MYGGMSPSKISWVPHANAVLTIVNDAINTHLMLMPDTVLLLSMQGTAAGH